MKELEGKAKLKDMENKKDEEMKKQSEEAKKQLDKVKGMLGKASVAGQVADA